MHIFKKKIAQQELRATRKNRTAGAVRDEKKSRSRSYAQREKIAQQELRATRKNRTAGAARDEKKIIGLFLLTVSMKIFVIKKEEKQMNNRTFLFS